MTTLTVRGLPESIIDALKLRAASNGRSLEGELRVVLTCAAGRTAPVSVGQFLDAVVALEANTERAEDAIERLLPMARALKASRGGA